MAVAAATTTTTTVITIITITKPTRTWIHTAQTEDWFRVWSRKAAMADYIIVCFGKVTHNHHYIVTTIVTTASKTTNTTPPQPYPFIDNHYKQRFTAALKAEADFIRTVEATKGTFVYIFEDGHAAAQISDNLQDGARHMGAYQAWVQFVMTQVCPLSVLVERIGGFHRARVLL